MEHEAPLATVSDLIQQGCRVMACTPSLRQLIAQAISAATTFFSSSDELKLSYCTDLGEGYRPYASEYTDRPEQLDLVESFSCSITREAVKMEFPGGPGLRLYNTLLLAHGCFADFVESTTKELFRTLSIDLPSPQFRFGFREWSRLQINYAVTGRATRDLLHVLHEDGGFLTLAFATAPGLELVSSDGRIRSLWWPGQAPAILLAGGVLSAATNERVRTGYHQVRRHAEINDRYSLLYFADPDPRLLHQVSSTLSVEQIYAKITQGWLRSGVPPVQVPSL